VRLKVKLKQESIYTVGIKQKRDIFKFDEIVGEEIHPGMNTNQLLSLPIPIDVPVVHNQCPFINVFYYIMVTLDIPASFDLNVKLPVIITNQKLPFNCD